MIRTWFFLFGLALSGFRAAGETNSPSTAGKLFSLPRPQLRPLSAKIERLTEPIPAPLEGSETVRAPGANRVTEEAQTNAPPTPDLERQLFLAPGEFSPAEAAIYERLLQQGGFTRAAARVESPFGHALDTIFAPEFIHFSKVDVSCSILTAIQRKNPLCLLNPIFFQLTW